MTEFALPFLAVACGIVVLVWSSDRFVEGAASAARALGLSQLFIGMIVIGFGTSLPEMLVSALSSWQGNPGIALGNAYGSNIANITLILGITALCNPIPVPRAAYTRELPILLAVTAAAALMLWHAADISRLDAALHIALFAVLMYMSYRRSKNTPEEDAVPECAGDEDAEPLIPLRKALFMVGYGLALLMASSRALVWGAVEVARMLGVSDLTIGLTVVAIGTSLPELASSIAAARKNCHDMAVGNVIGSNLFNTLVVVGIAGIIQPIAVDPVILSRDIPSVAIATAAMLLFSMSIGGRRPIINRTEGGCLFALYIAYTASILITS